MRPLRPPAPARPPGAPADASARPPAGPTAGDASTAAPPRRGDRLAQRRAGQKRRSLTVRALRVAVPLLMVVIAAVLVGWIVGKARRRKAPAPSAAVSIHMTNPRFLGQDSHGRPYVLTGTDAVRDTQDPHLVAIVAPHLVLQPLPQPAPARPGEPPPQPFVVTGLNGLYHDDTHHLTLMGNVVVDDGRGNHFYSERGEIDTDSGDVTGRDHAHGVGPAGAVEGDAYALSDKGDHATFTGRVKSHWNTTKGAPAVAPGKGP